MTLYVESGGTDVDEKDDTLIVDVEVSGTVPVESNIEIDTTTETVTLSLSDVLGSVSISALLHHATERDRDAVVAWCSDNDISGGAITEDTLNEWLARSDLNITAALRIILKHLRTE